MSLSIGASYIDENDVIDFYHEDFIKHADSLMYKAKAKGKNGYVIEQYKK